jgi:hypothetical protein
VGPCKAGPISIGTHPSSFEEDLKRRGAYFDPSQEARDPDTGKTILPGGIHISVSIVPP